LFLIEARAAARYWRAFAGLLPRELGFPGRQGRGAVDRVNRALNYGYALLQNRIWLAVHYAGLEPSLGLLHSGRRRTPGLVFDLMEPFRQPVVDRTLLGLIGRGARLDVNERGDLTLRTRALLQRAIDRRLAAGVHHGDTLAVEIDRQAKALRRSLMDGGPCRAYRMTW
jgi:CRISPR-associated protein Cas1